MAGVKIDFFESATRERIAKYDMLAHQAALPVVFVSYITHIAESPEILEAHLPHP